jgi:hypothetical protein
MGSIEFKDDSLGLGEGCLVSLQSIFEEREREREREKNGQMPRETLRV